MIHSLLTSSFTISWVVCLQPLVLIQVKHSYIWERLSALEFAHVLTTSSIHYDKVLEQVQRVSISGIQLKHILVLSQFFWVHGSHPSRIAILIYPHVIADISSCQTSNHQGLVMSKGYHLWSWSGWGGVLLSQVHYLHIYSENTLN